MSKSADDLLAFNDFENYGESPEISVNSPKKVTNDGEQDWILVFIYNFLMMSTWCSRGNTNCFGEGFVLPDRVLSTVFQHRHDGSRWQNRLQYDTEKSSSHLFEDSSREFCLSMCVYGSWQFLDLLLGSQPRPLRAVLDHSDAHFHHRDLWKFSKFLSTRSRQQIRVALWFPSRVIRLNLYHHVCEHHANRYLVGP